jgi:hypothetical protein
VTILGRIQNSRRKWDPDPKKMFRIHKIDRIDDTGTGNEDTGTGNEDTGTGNEDTGTGNEDTGTAVPVMRIPEPILYLFGAHGWDIVHLVHLGHQMFRNIASSLQTEKKLTISTQISVSPIRIRTSVHTGAWIRISTHQKQ